MFKKNSFGITLSLLCFLQTTSYVDTRKNLLGVFTNKYATLPGIVWGNWGSRPYEYAWVASAASLQGKNVIDLGVGLPSQYTWYAYVVNNLQPNFYAGIDFDGRIQHELVSGSNFEIKHMNMAALTYPDNYFDIALCISTFEHIPYDIFLQSIREAHRVLKDNGLLIITLDECWDKDQPRTHANGWNDLEQSVIARGLFTPHQRSFGLPEFLTLIQEYFVLVQEDAIVDGSVIRSSTDNYIYYDRANRDEAILHSAIAYNSCVSYAVLKKVTL